MPTTIVIAPEVSDNVNGLISDVDLTRIISGFTSNDCVISSTSGRQIVKNTGFSVPLAAMAELVTKATSIAAASSTDLSKMNINLRFGISLAAQKSCDGNATDLSNHLVAVLLICKDDVEMKGQDDYVITPGFKVLIPAASPIGLMGGQDCCPHVPPKP